MKTRLSFFLLCLLLCTVNGFAKQKNRDGNGKVVTKNIPISAYDAVAIAGNIDFEYVQSDGTPSLELTIDENLLSYVDIRVKGRELKIAPQDPEDRNGRDGGFRFNPTVCKIKSNSAGLKEINSAGSGNFVIVSPMKIEKIEVNKAGSGSVNFTKKLTGYKAELNMAGSGSIEAEDLAIEQLECKLAGSGEVQLKGTVSRADYSVASSGEIKAYGCKTEKAECSVAGSGSIYVHAVESLDASIAGSGSISYKGHPSVSQSIIGSGSIRNKN